MGLFEHLKNVRKNLNKGSYTSEASVSQGIILPTLNMLGWDVFDTSSVIPEYTVEGRRVDYALCHPKDKPAVFIEVKKVGNSNGADRQLFEYAFHLGVPMAILTDGLEWSFYLPAEQGHYDERRVYKINLIERSIEEAEKRLYKYLKYDSICSGEALKAARSDYKNVARYRAINKNLPKAWRALLEEPDSLLLELFSEKVEDLCGFKPEVNACKKFLDKHVLKNDVTKTNGSKTHVSSYTGKTTSNGRSKKKGNGSVKSSDGYILRFKDEEIPIKSARGVMEELIRRLSQEDDSFLEKFASRKHGRNRSYLAKDKTDLYPNSPHLVEANSVEVAPGWWLGVNYSRKSIQKIINLALDVAGPELNSKIEANVYQG